jgi:hypothetical protein
MENRQDDAFPTGGRPTMTIRSAGAGLLALGLGLAVHTVSGGAPPSTPILCGLAALAVLASTLVAQARLPVWAVLLLSGLAQQVLHWLLGGLGGATTSSPGTGVHHGGAVPVGSGTGQGHSPEVMLMLHTHLAAALLAGWVAVRYPGIAGWVARRRGLQLEERKGAPIE